MNLMDDLADKIIVKYALEGVAVPDKLLKQIMFMKIAGEYKGDPWNFSSHVQHIFQAYDGYVK
jgi:hypothetical protein